jgi:hypothetical protein
LGAAGLLLVYAVFDYRIKYLGAPLESVGMSTALPAAMAVFYLPILSLLPWILTFLYNAIAETKMLSSKKLSSAIWYPLVIDEHKKF